MTKYKS